MPSPIYSRFFRFVFCKLQKSYKDKVMQIHSQQKGAEKDENIQKLINLEDPSNNIEIVIHVNMLKEGWDVTNLYTIIPLRTATSATLREQTIGRGLRLPYKGSALPTELNALIKPVHNQFYIKQICSTSPNANIIKICFKLSKTSMYSLIKTFPKSYRKKFRQSCKSGLIQTNSFDFFCC
jgi:restriction endonuclease